MELFYNILLLFLSSYIIWKVCDSFQIASMFLGRFMPIGTRGATINAIGSSFPEFMTSFIAIFYYTQNDGAMFGISNTTGTVIYNITVIPFCVFIACYFFKNLDKLEFKKYILIRDGIFLILIQIVLTVILLTGKFTLINSSILVFLYLVYLIIIFNFPRNKTQHSKGKSFQLSIENKSFVKAFLDIDLYSILFKHHKKTNYINSVIVLCLSIVVFYFSCKILVSSSYNLGTILNIPSYLIALTITAIATSIPDTVISVKDAKLNDFDDAITNAFGSNIFNISFCIGFPIMIYNLIYNTDIVLGETSTENIRNLKNLSILLIILVVLIFTSKNKKWIAKGFILLTIYILFLYYVYKETGI